MLAVEWRNPIYMAMQTAFNSLKTKAFYLSHYELAEKFPEFTANQWREFILEPQVYDYTMQELRLLKRFETQKILENISAKSKSVGTAQMLTALEKLKASDDIQSGPIFIYCYVPPNDRESLCDNIQVLPRDPFQRS